MKKSTYMIIAIIIILMIAIICVFAFSGNNKKENNTNANIVIQNKQNENEVVNKQEYEVLANETEKEIENALTNEINKNTVENTTSSEIFEESPKTAEERAIDIAKKDFGENSNAEFSVEGIDGNGNYIVTVRNAQTTEALAFYTVNVANQTFTKREMN